MLINIKSNSLPSKIRWIRSLVFDDKANWTNRSFVIKYSTRAELAVSSILVQSPAWFDLQWSIDCCLAPAKTWIFVFSIISQLCLWENWIGLLDFTAISSTVLLDFIYAVMALSILNSEIKIKSVQSQDLIWFQQQIPREWNESLWGEFLCAAVEHLENISARGIRS